MPRTFLFSLFLVALLPTAVAAKTCMPTDAFRAQTFSGEISGRHIYAQQIEPNLYLELQPIEFGWRIKLRDDNHMDLASAASTPRFGISPLDLEGWHFRNAANSGANDGGINAPQQERRFSFSISSADRKNLDKKLGFGWLMVRDLGLADLRKGQRARLVYLRFDGCLMIPITAEETLAGADFESPVFLSEEIELAGRCGLNAHFQLDAWILPRWLDGDFDADGAMDFAAPAIRISDGHRVIVICRAGTWLTILEDPLTSGPDLPPPDYLQRIEAWRLGPVTTLQSGGRPIILERLEKSAYSLSWLGQGFATEHLFGLNHQ